MNARMRLSGGQGGMAIRHRRGASLVCLMAGALIASWADTPRAAEGSKTILEEWGSVKVPDPPEAKAVRADPKDTALLILDIEKRTANPERRPRAVASVPAIQLLLEKARASGAPVAYSTTGGSTPQDILAPVAPQAGEPVVKASVDKFYKTDLEEILKAKNVKNVIIVGTAAEGAVVHTATAAAMRGFKVIVPVDGMSSSDLYPEQYVCWHLLNAPGTRDKVTLTKIGMIEFGP